ARTASLTPPPTAQWWRPSLRWLVPLTAAAAAVVVWMIVPTRDVVSVRQVSQNAAPTSQLAPAAPAPKESPTVTAVPESTVASNERRDAQTTREAEASRAEPSRRSTDSLRSAAGAQADREQTEADKKALTPADSRTAAEAWARTADASRPNAAGEQAQIAKADVSRRSADLSREGERARAEAGNAAAAAAAPP